MEIIKFHFETIELNGQEINSINSREVYDYLEVDTRYNDWIQRAVEKYGFEEDIDYSILSNGTSRGIDFIVTLDMAKELCMVSNTEKGKETRKYFIQKEKELANTMKSMTRMEIIAKMADSMAKQERLSMDQEKKLQVHNERIGTVESRQDELEEKMNGKDLGIKPDRGFTSINQLSTAVGLSKEIIEATLKSDEFGSDFQMRKGRAVNIVGEGVQQPYTTYNEVDSLDRIAELVTTATKLSDKYYESNFVLKKFSIPTKLMFKMIEYKNNKQTSVSEPVIDMAQAVNTDRRSEQEYEINISRTPKKKIRYIKNEKQNLIDHGRENPELSFKELSDWDFENQLKPRGIMYPRPEDSIRREFYNFNIRAKDGFPVYPEAKLSVGF